MCVVFTTCGAVTGLKVVCVVFTTSGTVFLHGLCGGVATCCMYRLGGCYIVVGRCEV